MANTRTAARVSLPSLNTGEPGATAGALARLKAGNARFISGETHARNLDADRKAVAAGQQPYAIVLACSDSRVPPELLFDETVGQLFVVRVAGNVVDPVVLGSIEFAVEYLHSGLIVVLGHDSCGAVQAALAGGDAPPHIDSLVERIAPAVREARSKGLPPDATLDAAISENVQLQMQNLLSESALLGALVREHELFIAGGVYHLHSGRVEFLPAFLGSTRN